MAAASPVELSLFEFHVLLALTSGPMYGYALKDAIHRESFGTITARPGSLYRVLARFTTSGLVRETRPADQPPAHPGPERRYYALTHAGRVVLGAEARRLKRSALLAERRLGVAPGRS